MQKYFESNVRFVGVLFVNFFLKQMSMRFSFLLLLLSLLILSACTKNIDVDNLESPEYEPEFALPLINLETPVTDILEDLDPANYNVDENGLVTYSSNAFDIVNSDTVDVDLSDIGESIISMEYKFVIENGVPVTGNIQLYFLNESQEILDSLLSTEQQIILPANVDANGNVSSASYQEIIVPFDNEEVQQIIDTKQLLINSRFDPDSDGNIYTSQNISFRLGAKVVFDL